MVRETGELSRKAVACGGALGARSNFARMAAAAGSAGDPSSSTLATPRHRRWGFSTTIV